MDILFNILFCIIISFLVCLFYDFIKSYLLTKKIKRIYDNKAGNNWSDFWSSIPTPNDFDDKDDE